MRILVTGKSGQVVSAIKQISQYYDHEIITIGRPEIDFAEPTELYDVILKIKPDVLVSAAAYTMVDKAECEIELAEKVNIQAPRIMAKACKNFNIPIIHLSTDYVFPGDKSAPYIETDETEPQTIYGKTKLLGEKAIAEITPNHVILRTAWVYSPFGSNFVKTMIRLAENRDEVAVVSDQHGNPTSALEIARAIFAIAERIGKDDSEKLRGIFHMTANGEACWADFARKIFSFNYQYSRRNTQVNNIKSIEYQTPAKRPSNSRLDCQKLFKVYGLKLQNWEDSLNECMEQIYKDLSGVCK